MKFFLVTILLLGLVACSESSGPATVPTPNGELAPLSEPQVEIESVSITNNARAELVIKSSEKNFLLEIFNDEVCQNKIATVNVDSLIKNASVELKPDQENKIFIKIGTASVCRFKIAITQDQTSPEPPVNGYFLNQSTSTNNLSIKTGGFIADFSEAISSVRYYYLQEYNSSIKTLIKEVSLATYLSKEVYLDLQAGDVNYFKIAVVDLAGNESPVSASPAIFEQTSQELATPFLNYEINALNEGSTSSEKIRLQGIVSAKADTVSIYKDLSKTVLVSQVSASSFIDNGIEVLLDDNHLNEFFIFAESGLNSSSPLKFSITRDTINPGVPLIDPDVVSDNIYEKSESAAEITGQVESEVTEIYVYTDESLLNVYTVGQVSNGRFLIQPPFPHYGDNTFYVVARDAAGNLSAPAVVSLTYLDYDEY